MFKFPPVEKHFLNSLPIYFDISITNQASKEEILPQL